MAGPRKGPGRPAGSRNKRTIALRDRLDELGADPAEFLAQVMLGKHKCLKSLTAAEKAKLQNDAAGKLQPYVYPRLSSLDIDLQSNMGAVRIVIKPDERPAVGKPEPEGG